MKQKSPSNRKSNAGTQIKGFSFSLVASFLACRDVFYSYLMALKKQKNFVLPRTEKMLHKANFIGFDKCTSYQHSIWVTNE